MTTIEDAASPEEFIAARAQKLYEDKHAGNIWGSTARGLERLADKIEREWART